MFDFVFVGSIFVVALAFLWLSLHERLGKGKLIRLFFFFVAFIFLGGGLWGSYLMAFNSGSWVVSNSTESIIDNTTTITTFEYARVGGYEALITVAPVVIMWFIFVFVFFLITIFWLWSMFKKREKSKFMSSPGLFDSD